MSKYIISIWNVSKDGVTQFIEQANNHHPTKKFTAEISETEITFLDTNVFKGERFASESILDVKTHFKPTETFQYTYFSSCHPPGVKKGFSKAKHSDFSEQIPQKQNLHTGEVKTNTSENLV